MPLFDIKIKKLIKNNDVYRQVNINKNKTKIAVKKIFI